MPASSELSKSISKDMKKRGFKFVGAVIIYSFYKALVSPIITKMSAFVKAKFKLATILILIQNK